MTEPIEWMITSQAAQALSISPMTVNSWARIGKLAGSAKDDRGAWLVRHAEVDRILMEREQVAAKRLARWRPMTARASASGYGPADDEGQHP